MPSEISVTSKAADHVTCHWRQRASAFLNCLFILNYFSHVSCQYIIVYYKCVLIEHTLIKNPAQAGEVDDSG